MKPPPKVLLQIIEILKQSDTICITGHVRPDGDCVGSMLGLAYALAPLGKKLTVWNEDPVPKKLAFLDPKGWVQPPSNGYRFDCVMSVDAASMERLGSVIPCIQDRKIFINLDHHQSNTRFGDVNWVEPLMPSSGELIYKLLRTAEWPITPAMADCLFTAVSTDTGSFQYPSTLPETYHTAGELVKKGANLEMICDEVYQSYPLARIKLLKHVYNTFRLTCQNRLAYFWLRKKDFIQAGASTTDSEGLIDHVRAIDPVVVACVFEEMEPEVTRVSFRSKSQQINVNEIASLFGGGGHPAASGARIVGKPLAVQRRVVAALKKALAKSQE